MKNFYEELNRNILQHEEFKPYKEHDVYWICDKIEWCWKWRKISEEQMHELADRICKVMEDMCK